MSVFRSKVSKPVISSPAPARDSWNYDFDAPTWVDLRTVSDVYSAADLNFIDPWFLVSHFELESPESDLPPLSLLEPETPKKGKKTPNPKIPKEKKNSSLIREKSSKVPATRRNGVKIDRGASVEPPNIFSPARGINNLNQTNQTFTPKRFSTPLRIPTGTNISPPENSSVSMLSPGPLADLTNRDRPIIAALSAMKVGEGNNSNSNTTTAGSKRNRLVAVLSPLSDRVEPPAVEEKSIFQPASIVKFEKNDSVNLLYRVSNRNKMVGKSSQNELFDSELEELLNQHNRTIQKSSQFRHSGSEIINSSNNEKEKFNNNHSNHSHSRSQSHSSPLNKNEIHSQPIKKKLKYNEIISSSSTTNNTIITNSSIESNSNFISSATGLSGKVKRISSSGLKNSLMNINENNSTSSLPMATELPYTQENSTFSSHSAILSQVSHLPKSMQEPIPAPIQIVAPIKVSEPVEKQNSTIPVTNESIPAVTPVVDSSVPAVSSSDPISINPPRPQPLSSIASLPMKFGKAQRAKVGQQIIESEDEDEDEDDEENSNGEIKEKSRKSNESSSNSANESVPMEISTTSVPVRKSSSTVESSKPQRISASIQFTPAASISSVNSLVQAQLPAKKSINSKISTGKSTEVAKLNPTNSISQSHSRPSLKSSKSNGVVGNSNTSNNSHSRHSSHSSANSTFFNELFSEDDELSSLLAAHNQQFRPKPVYVPRQHSLADLKRWEKFSGKQWYKMNPEEREKANEEITHWIHQNPA